MTNKVIYTFTSTYRKEAEDPVKERKHGVHHGGGGEREREQEKESAHQHTAGTLTGKTHGKYQDRQHRKLPHITLRRQHKANA